VSVGARGRVDVLNLCQSSDCFCQFAIWCSLPVRRNSLVSACVFSGSIDTYY
jgi:hypothetical protein